MRLERAERLGLQVRLTPIELVATGEVRAARPLRAGAIRAVAARR